MNFDTHQSRWQYAIQKRYKELQGYNTYHLYPTMEIVKAFSSNKLNININVKGDHANPLFRATDVALVLENTNIHAMINDIDDEDKVFIQVDTNGGKQNVVFLTETGLYDVLCKSRKPIAKVFRKWVCEIVREIRINGSYTLQNQLELAQQQLVDNKRVIAEKQKEIEEKEEENNDKLKDATLWKQLQYPSSGPNQDVGH